MFTVITKGNKVRQYTDIDSIERSVEGPFLAIDNGNGSKVAFTEDSPITWPADAEIGLRAIVDVKAGTLRFGNVDSTGLYEFVVSNYVEPVTSAPHVLDLIKEWPTDGTRPAVLVSPPGFSWRHHDEGDWSICGMNGNSEFFEGDWLNYHENKKKQAAPAIGTKHDQGKPILGAVPPHAELAVGRVLTFGAEKYTVLDFCDTVKTGKIIENTLCQKLGIALNVENKKELSPKVSVAHVIESQPVSQLYAKAVNESAKSQPKTVDVLLVMNETELNQDLKKRKLNSNIFVNTGKDLSQENEEKSMSSKDQPTPLISKEKEKQKDFDTFQNTELLSSNMKVFVEEGVQYVEAKSAHTLTMTIHLVSSEIYFAVSATKLLDCYKILLTLLNHYLNISVDINKFYSTKSGRGNWDKVEDHENRYMDAALRHLNAHRRGELTDSESGESHLAHAACCILFMLDKQERS